MDLDRTGFVPIKLHFRDSELPDLSLVQGDTGTRGYAVEFMMANGKKIGHSEQHSTRCYGINPDLEKKEAYYTQGVYENGLWYLEVPAEAVSESGTCFVQIALFTDKESVIQSKLSKIAVGKSIVSGGVLGRSIRMDYEKIIAVADDAKKVVDEAKEKAEKAEKFANEGRQALVVLTDNEKDRITSENARVQAEKDRARDYEAFSKAGKEATASLEASDKTFKEKIAEAEASVADAKTAVKIVAQNENDRIANEKARMSSEEARKTAESTREENETARKANEEKRKTSEDARVSAEELRVIHENDREANARARATQEVYRINAENERKENEAARIQAEKERVSQENTCQSQEETRQANETQRKNQEEARKEAESRRESHEKERESTEGSRITNESNRVNAEDKRKSAEAGRVGAESLRVEAETKRQNESKDAINRVNSVLEDLSENPVGSLAIKVANLEKSVNGKADKSELESSLSGKVDKTALDQSLAGKVDKVEGKDLSSNDYTNAEKEKLLGIQARAEKNKINEIRRNGSLQDIKAGVVDIHVPTRLSEFNNDANFAKESYVDDKINAKADKTHTHTKADVAGLESALDSKMDKNRIVPCQSEEDAKSKKDSGNYKDGTIFIIKAQG